MTEESKIMSEKEITVVSENHNCSSVPVSATLAPGGDFANIKLVDVASGDSVSCQWEKSDGNVLLSWIIDELEMGQTKKYKAIFDEEKGAEATGVSLTETGEGKIDIEIGGAFFTSYYFGDVIRPFFHPVIGPTGKSVTRGYPMVEGVPGENSDHHHHRAIYVAHGEVNHADNWSEGANCGKITHRSFDDVTSGAAYGRIVDKLEWVSKEGKVVLKETREMKFYNISPEKIVDVTLNFKALDDEDCLFGDTKEGGLMSLRVAGTMKVSSGGKMENSFGGVNEPEVWGKRAHWCDYSGPVGGEWVGVTLMDCQKNLRHPTYWHARNYGLMTANPFGISNFERTPPKTGDYILPAGEELVFNYRIYIHKGDAQEAKVAEKYNNFVHPPKVEVAD